MEPVVLRESSGLDSCSSFGSTGRHVRSMSTSAYLPPAVAIVQPEHIRGYVHTKKIRNYLVGSNLGEGSFAKVKEAFHVLVGEKVAMKIIDKKKAQQDPYVAKNFRREAKLLQMVRHPNIAQLYEVIETDSSFYLISELCSGGELMNYIYKKLRLDEEETLKFMKQIVSAIDHLHRAGIIHRDLKVENMLLDSRMDVKIIDFGLSNEEYIESVNGQTRCNTQCGSPAYAAPELLGHKEYGKEVDIWSIGVNMYAMLTGCLPYTVEPFNITALHAKMLENKMNPIPDHLSTDCKDLLQSLLRSNPGERITMAEIMEHPWMNEGHRLPFAPHPFPNKLRHQDITEEIVEHMVHTLKVRDSIEELKQELLTNRSTSATAVYYLLEARLNRYRQQHMRRVMKVSTHKPKRFSRDQGFYEGDDDDHLHSDTHSVASAPTRPRYSRHARRHTTANDPFPRKERPISFPYSETEEAMMAVQAPSSSSAADRRKSIPPMVLEKDIVTFTARKREKEAKQRQHKGFEGRKASTLPRKFSMASYQRESLKSHQHKAQTQLPVERTHSPQDPYEYDLPPQVMEPTDMTPTRPTTVHMMRSGYSHSHELNQIRKNLSNTLHPPVSNTKAWHSNPSTRNPSRQGSRSPSRNPSRVPSGSSIRAPPAGSTHLNIIDDEVDELTFHDVESCNVVIPSGERHDRRARAFTIGGGSSETMEQDDHLPSLPTSPQHTQHTPLRRQRSKSDVSERRNGFLSQAVTFEAPTDLETEAIVMEFLQVAEQLKMRDLVSGRGMLGGLLKGVQLQIQVKKGHIGMCHVAFQWMSGGDLRTYKEICDTFMYKIHL